MGQFYAGCADQLILHVRHRAWLAARPGKGKDRRSRAEIFQADEDAGRDRPELDLPPADFGGQLVDHLFDVGPSAAGEALTFQEIAAWSAATGIALDAWEASTLKLLSCAYLAELDAASDPSRPPPASVRPKKTRAEVSSTIREIFERLAAQDEARGLGASSASEDRPSQKRSVPAPAAPASRGRARSPARSQPK